MNKHFYKNNRSIRRKLVTIIITISCITLLIAACLFTILQLHEYQTTLTENIRTLARITGENVQASLLFDNAEDAQLILSQFKRDPRIISATIYSAKSHQKFAEYHRSDRVGIIRLSDMDNGYRFETGMLHVMQPIVFEKEPVNILGKVYIQASLDSIYDQLQRNLVIIAVIILFSLLFCYILTARLQQIISSPILALSEVTKRVRNEKDYSLRVERGDYLEIQHLCDDFNAMLSEIQKRDDNLIKLASYDPLTNLVNRKFFSDILDQAISSGQRKSQKHTLLFLDLDRFKHINDSLGHSKGDDLLIQASRRLEHVIRAEDTLARFGGDEFTVLLRDIDSTYRATEIAERILDVMNKPFFLGNHYVVVTPSIGIVMYPEHGLTAEELIQNADTAMYKSKHAGGNNFWFFTENMNKSAQKRLRMEEELRNAIHCKGVILYYQPQYNLHTQSIVGIEALARWQKEDGQLISPIDFIPLANETGLIQPLGRIIFAQAIAELKQMIDKKIYKKTISINMSAKQFQQKDLVIILLSLLKEYGLEPNHIEIEITEDSLIQHTEETITKMYQLKDHNIRLAIDDFGTGYSSLSYLKRFPFDTLKIDKTFIHDMLEKEHNKKLVGAIIDISHHLDLTVVAEGVESQEQLETLTGMGCEVIQGYYFSEPVEIMQLHQLIQQQQANKNKLQQISHPGQV